MNYYVIAAEFQNSDKVYYWKKDGGYTDNISEAEVYTEKSKQRNERYITMGLYYIQLPDYGKAVND